MTQLRSITLLIWISWPALAHDWLIVPGKRVGPVTAASNEAELRRAFGDAAVTRALIHIDEKTTAPGVEIYRGRPGESLAVVWPRKEKELSWPLLVIPCYGSSTTPCRGTTAAGVRVGLTIAELERLNGKPFLLYASTNPSRWTDPWWDGGKLASDLGEDIEFSLARTTIAPGPDPPEYSQDRYVESATIASKRPQLRVDRMHVYLLSGRNPETITDWTIGGRAWSILTSERIVPIREQFGAGAAHRTLEQAEEGDGNVPGIAIFDNQTDRSLTTRRGFDTTICGGPDGYSKCRWRMTGGLELHMTLAKLEQLNGGPFVFNGFGFDLGGIVTSWEGGKVQRTNPGLRIVVSCPGEIPQKMNGDGASLRSDDPEIRKMSCSADVM